MPAHIAYERMCRVEEYPLYRAGVSRVTTLSDTSHRWELAGGACAVAGAGLTVQVDERRPDALLRWHSVDGPACAETVTIRSLSPRRSRLTVEVSGPVALLEHLVTDLIEFKRRVEQDHPATGHHVNERPVASFRHRSNWHDGRLRGRTRTGPWPDQHR